MIRKIISRYKERQSKKKEIADLNWKISMLWGEIAKLGLSTEEGKLIHIEIISIQDHISTLSE